MAKQFKVVVSEKNCKSCGICSYFCPKKVLTQTMGHCPEVTDQAACIGCRLCQMRCPDFAIEVEEVQA